MAKPDPNKYHKNSKIKAESTLSLLLALVRVTLMLIGIFGITYELFRENGWISQLFGTVFDSSINMVIAALVLLALWRINRWISTPQKQDKMSLGDIPMYVMMTVGIYYLYHLYSTGRLLL